MEIQLEGITKRFPGVVANASVDLSLQPGEVHALLGENGAGKSTLMNVLYGLYGADEGRILIDGEEVSLRNPSDAIKSGIGMVHQHFMLIPVFTVAENIVLGSEPMGALGLVDHDQARDKVASISKRYGLVVDPDAVVEDLPVGVQQRVEILKALYRDAECLILDEPTAVLTPQEIDALFDVIRALKEAGRSVVFITHKLKEVLEIADRITVLRRGRVVGTLGPTETNEQKLAEMMVGRKVQLQVARAPTEPGAPELEVRDLVVLDDRGHRAVDGATFDLRAKEILAVAGVQGNGQTELVEAITGMRKVESGSIILGGVDITHAKPRAVFDQGASHVPENRQDEGLILPFPIKDNLVLNTYAHKPYARGLMIDRAAVQRDAQAMVDAFDVRTPSIEAPASTLSGGNQQKVVVAREFSRDSKCLIAAQPTRGLDVGSIQYIHSRLIAKRDEGVAVLLVSSELDEIMALGDRIAVMYQGRVVGIVDSDKATREGIGLLMAGAADDRVSPGEITG